jgi:hypothetical protein
MPRPYVIYVHFNKQLAKEGFPWTVHYRGKCIPASWVDIRVPSTTIYRPERRNNPRAFIRCVGTVRVTSRNNNVRIT